MMALPSGLTASQARQYLIALNSESAHTKTRVRIMDLDHRHKATYTDALLDGQVDFNRRGDVERSATLTLADLTDDLAELDLRHLVRAEHGVYVDPAIGDEGWVWCPVITGRVMGPSDGGDTATLEIHGKESFGLLPGHPTRTWGRGLTVAEFVRDAHADIGETKFRISRRLLREGPTLGERVHTGGADTKKAPTRVARRMARNRGLQVFWDGDGFLVVREKPNHPLITWSETGDQLLAAATGPIQWTRDLKDIRNTVTAKGKRDRVTVDADDLYRNHIYSPRRLERGGVPGRIRHYLTDESITDKDELRQTALSTLRRLLTERSQASLSCVPVFHVGPHDLVRAERRDGRFSEFWLDEASIPLTGSDDMSVGYQQVQRRQRVRRGRRR